MNDAPKFLSRVDAAAFLRSQFGLAISRQWLARAAVSGAGPAYRRSGKSAVYAPGDLSAWAAARMSRPVRRASDLDAFDRYVSGDEMPAAPA